MYGDNVIDVDSNDIDDIPSDEDELTRFDVIANNEGHFVIPPKTRMKGPPKLTRMRCWPEVLKRLEDGFSPNKLVEYIQNDCNEYTHVTPESLQVILYEYRKNKMPDYDKVAKHLPDYAAKALARLEAGINEVKELQMLYALNMSRIESSLEQESEMGFLNGQLTNAMKLSKDILQSSAEIKVSVGLPMEEQQDKKELVLLNVGSQVSEVLKNNESRNKLLEIIKRAKKLKGMDKDDLAEIIAPELTVKQLGAGSK